MPDVILLNNVRLSFPHLVEPQVQINQKTGEKYVTYNCDLILEENDPSFEKFLKRYGELAIEKWEKNAAANETSSASMPAAPFQGPPSFIAIPPPGNFEQVIIKR